MPIPDKDTFTSLLATVATIVATLTGLIGAFSTARLQNIDTEIDFLKGMVLHKNFGKDKSLNDYLKGDQYHLLEKIYDLDLNAVKLLREIIAKHKLEEHSDELMIDCRNIEGNQLKYNQMKRLTINSFIIALSFVFANLIMLFFSKCLLVDSGFFRCIMVIYSFCCLFIFILFIIQIKKLV